MGEPAGGGAAEVDLRVFQSEESIREWWYYLLKHEDKYVCYALFLMLPNDEQCISYVRSNWREIDLVSGRECLVITFEEKEFRASVKKREYVEVHISEKAWKNAAKDYPHGKYSTVLSQMFDIPYDEFPCLVLLKDIASPEYAVISLKDMTSKEIRGKVREIFSLVRGAAKQSIHPITYLNRRKRRKSLMNGGKTIIRGVRSAATKTLEIAMEAWINVLLKP